jgi:hypothetical protein
VKKLTDKYLADLLYRLHEAVRRIGGQDEREYWDKLEAETLAVIALVRSQASVHS